MPTIEISEETYEKIKDQLNETEKTDISSWEDMVGKKFYFRMVTYHAVGKVVSVNGSIMKLEDASWVADSGRFMNALKDGELDEVEPTGEHFINIYSIVDFFPWKHELPKYQK